MGEGLSFGKQVMPARPCLRLGFVFVMLVAMAAIIVVLQLQSPPQRLEIDDLTWSSRLCTPSYVEMRIANREMREYERIGCLVVAGKIDGARTRLLALPPESRRNAIEALIFLADPIAKPKLSGDGAHVALVAEFDPGNPMATFYMGMAELALGHDANARDHLERFLASNVPADNVWRRRAEQGLFDIAANTPLDQRETRFPE